MNIESKYLQKIKINKSFTTNRIEFPMANEYVALEVIDEKNDNNYLFDINRKQAIEIRCTYQTRYNKTIQLLRLDLNSKPHKNPDGEIIKETHIHIYTEAYGTAYAVRLDNPILHEINPSFDLKKLKTENIQELFVAFSEFCNIKNIPAFNTII
ncbi:hypothetical protein ABGF48_04750 [Helcococcus bovis]|uniref:DUF6978 family protein n=1 Tax=Helcococcus bovis TaxID=3153252 RepID=UPI0038BCC071